MFRTTMFALAVAALSSTAALAAGEQPPRVNESHAGQALAQVDDTSGFGRQTVRVGHAGRTVQGFQQVAEVSTGEARGANGGR